MNLNKKNKAELLEICSEKGIDVDGSETNKVLVSLIEKAQSSDVDIKVAETAENSTETKDDEQDVDSNDSVDETPSETPNSGFEGFYIGKANREYSIGVFKTEALAKKELSKKGSKKTRIEKLK